jgi:hypothetical protein
MQLPEDLDKLKTSLKHERDELKLKAHLLGMEAKEKWDKAEENWEHFQGKTKKLGEASKESSGDVIAALKLLGEEIKQAYDHVRKSI